MLFLLDFDCQVREADLFEHFEPFLAPIRQELELQYEEDLHNQRQWYSEAVLEADYASKSLPFVQTHLPRQVAYGKTNVYESPATYVADRAGRSLPALNASTISLPAPAHQRQPSPYRSIGARSISPPSIRDVPSLSRSTTGNHSRASSSRSSSLAPSSRGTPANISCGHEEVYVVDSSVSPSMTSNSAYGAAIAATRPTLKGHQISFSNDAQQPAKKVKTASSGVSAVMSRFFTSASGDKSNKTAYQQPVVA